MPHKLLRPYSLLLFCFFWVGIAQGQNDKILLHELAEENKKSVEALALYPPDTRLAILEAATYPEILIKMNNVRQKTAAAFRRLIEDFPQSTQLVFYEIARYPNLLQQLADQAAPLGARQEALQQLPEEYRREAIELTENQMSTLLKISELDQTARLSFKDLMEGYPAPAQSAFRQLIELPEVLEILNQDLRFTVLIGDVYRDDPAWVIRKTDSLNLAVARANAEETEEWKQQLESDPQAQQEFQEVAQEYADTYGYPMEEEESGQPYAEEDFNIRGIVVHHYPWWFGYPWWYQAPCWEPYPWWYHWGFRRHHHRFVIIYMPSGHFMDWYFHHPRHHHHYSHLSAHFVRHYYGHRHSSTTISMGVGNWRDRNKALISDEWMKDRDRLPQRLAEYGRFEESRQAYNSRNPKKQVDQETYLDKNPHKFPELEYSKTQAREEIKRERESVQTRPSDWAPSKDRLPSIPKAEPGRAPGVRPDPKPKKPAFSGPQQDKPVDKRTKEPVKERPSEKAEDYHRRQWEKSKHEEIRREQTPAPKPQARKETAIKPKPQKNDAPQPKNHTKDSKTGNRKN